jgi:SAM-dependent methyltransferase
MQNPWLKIPAADYEAHMASPNVDQLRVLSALFSEVLNEFLPTSVAVLGCATGNGFEHVKPSGIDRVVGVDINPAYLEILKDRFLTKIKCLELIEADISYPEFRIEPVSVIFAGLVFEFVNVSITLNNIVRCLKPGGVLVAALQKQKSDSSLVTPTIYGSLRSLASIANLVSPAVFSNICTNKGLLLLKNREVGLKSGKSLFVGFYQKGAEPTNPADPKGRAAD